MRVSGLLGMFRILLNQFCECCRAVRLSGLNALAAHVSIACYVLGMCFKESHPELPITVDGT